MVRAYLASTNSKPGSYLTQQRHTTQNLPDVNQQESKNEKNLDQEDFSIVSETVKLGQSNTPLAPPPRDSKQPANNNQRIRRTTIKRNALLPESSLQSPSRHFFPHLRPPTEYPSIPLPPSWTPIPPLDIDSISPSLTQQLRLPATSRSGASRSTPRPPPTSSTRPPPTSSTRPPFHRRQLSISQVP